jgi:hypothetical protein
MYIAIMGKSATSYIHNKNVIYIMSGVIGVAALLALFDRDYYLPFLGPCAFPTITTKNKTSATDTDTTQVLLTDLPPNTTVVYWAAKSSNTPIATPSKAYMDDDNNGEVVSDSNGNALVTLNCPAEYYVSKFGLFNTKLHKHVHYRYKLQNGLFSRVYTKNVSC